MAGPTRQYVVEYKINAITNEAITSLQGMTRPIMDLSEKMTGLAEKFSAISTAATAANAAMSELSNLKIKPTIDLKSFKSSLQTMEVNALNTAKKIRGIMEAAFSGTTEQFNSRAGHMGKGQWLDLKPIDDKIVKKQQQNLRALKAAKTLASGQRELDRLMTNASEETERLMKKYDLSSEEIKRFKSGSKISKKHYVDDQDSPLYGKWLNIEFDPNAKGGISKKLMDSLSGGYRGNIKNREKVIRANMRWAQTYMESVGGGDKLAEMANNAMIAIDSSMKEYQFKWMNAEQMFDPDKGPGSAFHDILFGKDGKGGAVHQTRNAMRAVNKKYADQSARIKNITKPLEALSGSSMVGLMSEAESSAMANNIAALAGSLRSIPAGATNISIGANVTGNYLDHVATISAFVEMYKSLEKTGTKNIGIDAKVTSLADADKITRLKDYVAQYTKINGKGKAGNKKIGIDATTKGVPSLDVIGRLEKFIAVFNGIVSGTKEVTVKARVSGLSDKQLNNLMGLGGAENSKTGGKKPLALDGMQRVKRDLPQWKRDVLEERAAYKEFAKLDADRRDFNNAIAGQLGRKMDFEKHAKTLKSEKGRSKYLNLAKEAQQEAVALEKKVDTLMPRLNAADARWSKAYSRLDWGAAGDGDPATLFQSAAWADRNALSMPGLKGSISRAFMNNGKLIEQMKAQSKSVGNEAVGKDNVASIPVGLVADTKGLISQIKTLKLPEMPMVKLAADIKGLNRQIYGAKYVAKVKLIPLIRDMQNEMNSTMLTMNANVGGTGTGGGGPGGTGRGRKGAARGKKDWRIAGSAMSSMTWGEHWNNLQNQISWTESERLQKAIETKEAFTNLAYGPGMETKIDRDIWAADEAREERRVANALEHLESVKKAKELKQAAEQRRYEKVFGEGFTPADERFTIVGESPIEMKAAEIAKLQKAMNRNAMSAKEYDEAAVKLQQAQRFQANPNNLPAVIGSNYLEIERAKAMADANAEHVRKRIEQRRLNMATTPIVDGLLNLAETFKPIKGVRSAQTTIGNNIVYGSWNNRAAYAGYDMSSLYGSPLWAGMPKRQMTQLEIENRNGFGFSEKVSPRRHAMAMSADEFLAYKIEMERQAEAQRISKIAAAERMRDAGYAPFRDFIDSQFAFDNRNNAQKWAEHQQRAREYEGLDWGAWERKQRKEASAKNAPKTIAQKVRQANELRAKGMNFFAQYANSATEQKDMMKHRRYLALAQKKTGFDIENASIFDQIDYLNTVRDLMEGGGVVAPHSLNKRIKDLEKKSQVNPKAAAQKGKAFTGKDPNSWRKILYQFAGNTSVGANTPAAIEMAKGFGVQYAIGGAMGMLSGAIGQAVDYQNVMTTAQAILKRNYSGGNFGADFAAMEKQTRQVGMDTKYTAPEVAGAVKFMAMAGLNVNDIKGSIAPIADIALIGDNDLSEVADKITNIQTAFGIRDGSKMRRVADQMANTFTKTNTDMMMIAESMQYAAPMAHLAGANVGDTLAMIGVMGNAGIQASMAGTTMRMMYQNVINPNKKQKAMWDALGIARTDKNGAPRNMIDILTDIASNKKVTDSNIAEVVSKLFRVTASAGAGQLIEDLRSDNSLVKRLRAENAGEGINGTSQQIAGEKKNTISGLWAQVTSAFTEVGVKIFEEFQGDIKTMLGDLVNFFKSKETLNALRNAFDLIKEIGSQMLLGFREFMNLMGNDSGFAQTIRFLVKWFVIAQFWFGTFGQGLKLMASVIRPVLQLLEKFGALKHLKSLLPMIGNFFTSLFGAGGLLSRLVGMVKAGGAAGLLGSLKGAGAAVLPWLTNPWVLGGAAAVGAGVGAYYLYKDAQEQNERNEAAKVAYQNRTAFGGADTRYNNNAAYNYTPVTEDAKIKEVQKNAQKFASLSQNSAYKALFNGDLDSHGIIDTFLGGDRSLTKRYTYEGLKDMAAKKMFNEYVTNNIGTLNHKAVADILKKGGYSFESRQEARKYIENFNPKNKKGLKTFAGMSADQIGKIQDLTNYREFYDAFYKSLQKDLWGESRWTGLGYASTLAKNYTTTSNLNRVLSNIGISMTDKNGKSQVGYLDIKDGVIDWEKFASKMRSIGVEWNNDLSGRLSVLNSLKDYIQSNPQLSTITGLLDQINQKVGQQYDVKVTLEEMKDNMKSSVDDALAGNNKFSAVSQPLYGSLVGTTIKERLEHAALTNAITPLNYMTGSATQHANKVNALANPKVTTTPKGGNASTGGKGGTGGNGGSTGNPLAGVGDSTKDPYANKYKNTARPTQITITIDKLAQFDNSQFMTAEQKEMQGMIEESVNTALLNFTNILAGAVDGVAPKDGGTIS